MKKLMFAFVAVAVAVPALAQEAKIPQGDNAPAIEMKRDHEAFEKAHQAHQKEMKATQEKLEKLVKEYNKAGGKKKDAKRAELEKEVSAIHEKQLQFKQEQLARFEERLAHMKANFEKENAADAKASWTQEKTDALIQANGDVKALFDRPDMRGPKDGKGPRMGRPHKGFKGPKGPRPDGTRPDMND